MSNTIEELQKIVADESRNREEREAAAKHILALQGAQEGGSEIADDDPELAKYLCHPDSDVARYFGGATTIEAAKKLLAKDRHQGRLLATAANEALPPPQRIEAAVAWRSLRPAGNRWASLRDSDLVESLSTHPHLDRLQQLSALVCDSVLPKGTDWRAYLQDQWAAISEFHALRQKHPLRDAPAVISLNAVANRIIKDRPLEVKEDSSARQEVYGYAKSLQQQSLDPKRVTECKI